MSGTDEASGLEVEHRDHVVIVRFNRPEIRNPLSRRTLEALASLLHTISSQSEITAVIFTGSGSVFAAGADIRELAQLNSNTARVFSQLGQQVFDRISKVPQLTLAAINGYCMGGALDLALACDIRLAGSNAAFAHPGASLGIITGWGGTQRLPRLIGKARAAELFFTARRIEAEEARRIGLVSLVA